MTFVMRLSIALVTAVCLVGEVFAQNEEAERDKARNFMKQYGVPAESRCRIRSSCLLWTRFAKDA